MAATTPILAARKKSICIFGAGPAGICAARHCTRNSGEFEVVVFEQNSDIGGVWRYEPLDNELQAAADRTHVHSSMYEKMNTNLPKEVMYFDKFPFDNSSAANNNGRSADQSFVSHQNVLAFLEEYAKPVRHLIQFNSKVVSVERLINNNEHSTGAEVGWAVSVEQPATGGTKTTLTSKRVFDCVFVCNGHFVAPMTPEFADNYRRVAIHSHFYRRADTYAGMRVAVVGAGPSGTDIALQIAKHARKVYLLHRKPSPQNDSFGVLPACCEEKAAAVDADADSLILADGSRLDNLDAVIFCTGYRYEFPFLSPAVVQTPFDGAMVSPLFAHCVHVDYYDSLFLIGLNIAKLPVIFDFQILLALAFIRGTVPPQWLTRERLVAFEEDRIELLKKRGSPMKHFHKLDADQWPYYRFVASFLGRNAPTVAPVVQAMFDHVTEQRKMNLRGYKRLRYTVCNEHEFRAEMPANEGEEEEYF